MKDNFVWCQRSKCTLKATKAQIKTQMQMNGEAGTWGASKLPRKATTASTLRRSQARGRDKMSFCFQGVGSETQDDINTQRCTHPCVKGCDAALTLFLP